MFVTKCTARLPLIKAPSLQVRDTNGKILYTVGLRPKGSSSLQGSRTSAG